MAGKLERYYQHDLVKRIEQMLPGCIVLMNDPQYLQGIPDLTVLYGPYYALLEVKRSYQEMLRPQPNQDHYISKVAEMHGFSSYVYPENEVEVLNALQRALKY